MTDTQVAADLLQAGWLRELEQRAGVDEGWARRVRARVRRAQEYMGDSWQERTLVDLLEEVREEVEDVGGWAGWVKLKVRAEVPTEFVYHEVMAWLEEAVVHAILADRAIGNALNALQLQPK